MCRKMKTVILKAYLSYEVDSISCNDVLRVQSIQLQLLTNTGMLAIITRIVAEIPVLKWYLPMSYLSHFYVFSMLAHC